MRFGKDSATSLSYNRLGLVGDRIKIDVDHHLHAIGAVDLAASNATPATLKTAQAHHGHHSIIGVNRGQSVHRPADGVIGPRLGQTVDHIEAVMENRMVAGYGAGLHVGDNVVQGDHLGADEIGLHGIDIGSDARVDEQESAPLNVFAQVFSTGLIHVTEALAEKERVSSACALGKRTTVGTRQDRCT
jgi:hypothetical protein